MGLAVSAAPFLGGGWSTDDLVHVHRLLSFPSVGEIFRSPDPFGFYRPLAHTTLRFDASISGFAPVMWRVSNLIIHVLVVMASYRLARCLLTTRAAFLAALAFVLTPKAHTMAIFWASARPELLMSLFCLLALICWIEWSRRGRLVWLAAAGLAYTLATLSKETAVLLPLLMLVTPPDGSAPARRRLTGAIVVLALAVIPIGLRISAGALMPFSADPHYAWDGSAYRWLRSAEVYLPRVLPAPAALALCVAFPAAVVAWRRGASLHVANMWSLWWLGYATLWFFAFIIPVLPIVARSELYLYLPGLGFCLFAGHLTDRVLASIDHPRLALVALATVIAGFCGYQVVREIESRNVLQFTQALVRAIEQDPWLQAYRGDLVVVPADPETEHLLRDGVWGYLDFMLENTLGRTGTNGVVAYAGQTLPARGVRVLCAYDGDRVRLSHESDAPPF